MLWIAVVCSALNTSLLTISGGMLSADYCGMLWITAVCCGLLWYAQREYFPANNRQWYAER